jgi:hypothetical protein
MLMGDTLLTMARSPIAFHPASVLFETPNHAELLDKVGVRALVTGVVDELLALATAQGCTFPPNYRETTVQQMTQSQDNNSTMYMDFEAKRPMEIETYLGSPLKLAQEAGVAVPRIETLYAVLHNLNIVNRTRPAAAPVPSPPNGNLPPPRMSSAPVPRGPPGQGPMMNGNGPMKGGPRPGSRAPSMTGPPPAMRRGPPSGPVNGYPPRHMNGGPMNGMSNGQRRPSLEGNDLEEFSHLMLYDNMVDDGAQGAGYENGSMSTNDLTLRERELMLRQKELQLREQELNMRRGPGPRRGPPAPMSHMGGFDEDDDEDDYFDPMASRGTGPSIDPDNFDMMSVTSRRNRKMPSASQIRKNPDLGMGPQQNGRSRNPFARPGLNKNRTSARLVQDVPGLHDSIMNNPLMGYSSNRYGDVDRGAMGAQSRANSLTATRLDELQQGGSYGAYPPMNRRISQSPGNPLSPGPRPMGRPSPPNGYPPNGYGPNGMPPNGMPPNGRPSPPGMRQPVPRHPPGHGNAVAPQQVEQHAGVSNLYPPKSRPQVRSLTGSASGSSGASAQLESEKNSAHSSQSSLGPRPALGVR